MGIPLRAILRELDRRNISFADTGNELQSLRSEFAKAKEFYNFLDKTVKRIYQKKEITPNERKQIEYSIRTAGSHLPVKSLVYGSYQKYIDRGIKKMYSGDNVKNYPEEWRAYGYQIGPIAKDTVDGIYDIMGNVQGFQTSLQSKIWKLDK